MEIEASLFFFDIEGKLGNPEFDSIKEMEINTVTNFKTVKLDSLNSKSLSVDSVRNNYLPFWKRLFASK